MTLYVASSLIVLAPICIRDANVLNTMNMVKTRWRIKLLKSMSSVFILASFYNITL